MILGALNLPYILLAAEKLIFLFRLAFFHPPFILLFYHTLYLLSRLFCTSLQKSPPFVNFVYSLKRCLFNWARLSFLKRKRERAVCWIRNSKERDCLLSPFWTRDRRERLGLFTLKHNSCYAELILQLYFWIVNKLLNYSEIYWHNSYLWILSV